MCPQTVRVYVEIGRGVDDLARDAAGIIGGILGAARMLLEELFSTLRRLLDVLRDLAGRRPLLFDRGGDRRRNLTMRLIVPEMVSIALTTSLVAVCAEICEEISPVAFGVCSASVFTSIATTAKPCRPRRHAAWTSSSPAACTISFDTRPVSLAAFLTPAILAETSCVPCAAC